MYKMKREFSCLPVHQYWRHVSPEISSSPYHSAQPLYVMVCNLENQEIKLGGDKGKIVALGAEISP